MISLLDKQSKPIIIRRARFCAGAGIGRQAWLRAMCRKAWRFKSSPAHHYDVVTNPRTFGDLCFANSDPKGFSSQSNKWLNDGPLHICHSEFQREQTFGVSH